MVHVPSAAVCFDQYEASVVDNATGAWSSPNYNPNNAQAQWQWNRFANMTVPGVPMPPRGAEFHRGSRYVPRAVSAAGVAPQAYVDQPNAAQACAVAGKRLCTHAEWKAACRGAANTTFPYGAEYVPGVCNAGVDVWPPGLIGRKNNWEMLDPRIAGLPYPGTHNVTLRSATGDFPRCVTAGLPVFDLVGNLAEVVSDVPTPGFMTFVGGFYARDPSDPANGASCERSVGVHAAVYNDYSIGFRCCTNFPQK